MSKKQYKIPNTNFHFEAEYDKMLYGCPDAKLTRDEMKSMASFFPAIELFILFQASSKEAEIKYRFCLV